MARGAQSLGAIRWGKMPPRSQYALFILAVTFTWLMGLMGFARSGIRQYWHVWQVVQDTSKYAATPALGYASKMISLCVLIFLTLVAFVSWLGGLMGFARSGIRQYWHVWQVVQDTSKYAATPALGYASKMISLCVLIFLTLVAFVFWLGGLAEKSTF